MPSQGHIAVELHGAGQIIVHMHVLPELLTGGLA